MPLPGAISVVAPVWGRLVVFYLRRFNSHEIWLYNSNKNGALEHLQLWEQRTFTKGKASDSTFILNIPPHTSLFERARSSVTEDRTT